MANRPPMSGWKTWTAAGLAVAYGLVGFLAGVHDLEVGMGFVVGGLGLVGVAHKVEKAGALPAEILGEAIVRHQTHAGRPGPGPAAPPPPERPPPGAEPGGAP